MTHYASQRTGQNCEITPELGRFAGSYLQKLKGILKKKMAKYDLTTPVCMSYLATLQDMFYFILTQKFVTSFVGPLFARSQDLIEIDITYACNLMCYNCNRSCKLAPSEDHLSLEQIRKFIRESIAKGVHWKRIRLLGGEPTLHPELCQILEEIMAFMDHHCPNGTVELVTNGFGGKVKGVLQMLKGGIVVVNSAKKSRIQYFKPFNLAPADFSRYRFSDFSCGCPIISSCGMGLTPYGFYPCTVSGGIDRVFGFNIGKKLLPSTSDSMRDQMEILCGYCGHFMTVKYMMLDKDLMSESWRRGFKNYKTSKPKMDYY